MAATASPDDVAAATSYESFFVPALFRPWAQRVLDAARVGPGDRVVDVACGTGVLAREAAARVGPSGTVAGLDRAPGMLAVAERVAPAIEWHQGSADALPFPDASFDVVGSQFGLMFFPDRVAALREMRRVLVPGGRLALAVWASLDRSPAMAAEVRVVETVAGPAAAEPMRTPFVLGDPGEVRGLAEEAGFADVDVAVRDGEVRFPGVRPLVEADVRGWLPMMGVVLAEEQIAEILREADRALAAFVQADGQLVFDMPAVVLTAVNAEFAGSKHG